MDKAAGSSMHIATFPWFAMGHFTPYLHLSNKLANKGHRISFFIPKRTQSKLHHYNLYPNLITFIPITIPHVDGLPHDAETTSDVSSLIPLLADAVDATKNDIELLLKDLKPQIVLFDFAHWLPNLARNLGIKSVQYLIINPVTASYLGSPARMRQGNDLTEADLMKPPLGFPDPPIKLHSHELKVMVALRKAEFGSGILLYDRLSYASASADAIGFKGCREIDGTYGDYLESQHGKPVIFSGPLLPEPPNDSLEEKWASWLSGFKPGSVVYCALGSEWSLQQSQFQELLHGLELTGFPFLAALKPPIGFDSVEDALPEGFKERVQGRGVVHGGWVQQQLILEHPSVGCFITHCGSASLIEALVNECQLVLLAGPYPDHVFNARSLGSNLKVGVEVEKDEEDGFFAKESVCRAVKVVMDDENEIGREVKMNHTKIRNLLLSDNFEASCVDSFILKLQNLLL